MTKDENNLPFVLLFPSVPYSLLNDFSLSQ